MHPRSSTITSSVIGPRDSQDKDAHRCACSAVVLRAVGTEQRRDLDLLEKQEEQWRKALLQLLAVFPEERHEDWPG